MKIKAIKVHQAVNFDKKVETYFTIIPTTNNAKVTAIEYVPEFMAWKVSNDSDMALIPIGNIIAVYPWMPKDDAHDAHKIAEKAKPIGVKGSEIKRPR